MPLEAANWPPKSEGSRAYWNAKSRPAWEEKSPFGAELWVAVSFRAVCPAAGLDLLTRTGHVFFTEKWGQAPVRMMVKWQICVYPGLQKSIFK